ncbi:MAG: hypothetical protein ABFD06_13640 [Smithella sp.]|jgi:hypothetical protein
MNFKRMIDVITVFFCIVVLAAIFLHSCQRQALKAEIMQLSDEQYILNNLKLRNADDCKLSVVGDGVWSCKEFKSEKIFIVRRPM